MLDVVARGFVATGDEEHDHAKLDALYEMVLAEIAGGISGSDAAALAQAALDAGKLVPVRWYA